MSHGAASQCLQASGCAVTLMEAKLALASFTSSTQQIFVKPMFDFAVQPKYYFILIFVLVIL